MNLFFCELWILSKITYYFFTYLALRNRRTKSKVTKTFTVKFDVIYFFKGTALFQQPLTGFTKASTFDFPLTILTTARLGNRRHPGVADCRGSSEGPRGPPRILGRSLQGPARRPVSCQ